jgi:hypothetical protein
VAASDPTDVPDGVPDDAVDELYCLPIEEFTPRRDALAKELRGDGQRDAATWVKGLRKPSAAAWVVNQLARSRTREAKELLAAGDGLRAAHERVVAGEAGADELRAAADAEHEAARALVTDAPGLLDRDGHPPSGPTLERVAETIRAVALDDEARAGFEKGRLTRERSASGFGPLSPSGPVARRKDGKRKAPAKARPAARGRVRGAGREPAPKAKPKAGARKALEKARTEQRARARDLKAAERELEAAQREAERAQARLEGAATDLEEARAREAEAQSRTREAEADLGS